MKREKFLWPLTQSHHRALVTAKRVKEKLSGGNEGAVREMAAEVQKLYDEELRLHFWDEEKILALYEEKIGREEPEPPKMRREHRQLEALLSRPERQNLLTFAALLTTHIRFEEDVFFGEIERVMGEGEKQAVGRLLEQEAALNCAVPR